MSDAGLAAEGEPPGKTRTWWHPLLASVLRWQLGEHYRVEEEVNVGTKPLQIDILLLRQQKRDLPETVRRLLAGLVEYLNEYTLVEFKSPSDTLRAGDFQTFLAYALLYRSQNQALLETHLLNLVVMAPRLTRPYKDELRVCGVKAEQTEAGVWQLKGGTLGHATWLLETEVLARRDHPVMTVFSPRLLQDTQAVSQQLRQQGFEPLVVYVTQQINQFQRQGEMFAMQHLGTDAEMQRMLSDLARTLPDDIRAELLSQCSPEERVKGLKPEERVKGLKPEERVKGLTAEEREVLLQLLQQEKDMPKKKPKGGKKA